MYAADDRDHVVLLNDFPQSSIGAPCPLVVQDEHAAVVGFYVEVPDPKWTGKSVRAVDAETSVEPAVLVRFHGVRATMFGPPNDEAFRGHPLAARGLTDGPLDRLVQPMLAFLRDPEPAGQEA